MSALRPENLQIHELDGLFEAVQMGSVFPDGKTFPDCIPKGSLPEIKQRYESEKDQPGFDLKTFIKENFTTPVSRSTGFKSDPNRPVRQHVEVLWEILTRQPDEKESSLIPLPHPYIVPGGRFGEIYYWDSYFTMLGLRISRKIDMVQHMVDNFAFLINEIGYIPNGNRTYYIGRSQPPFFSLMVQLLSQEKGEGALVRYLPEMEKEYGFWMQGKEKLGKTGDAFGRVVMLPTGTVLNRYWDANDTPRPESYKEDVELSHTSHQNHSVLFRHLRAAAESGWDFSSRWFSDPHDFGSIHTTDIVPVDLNCLLFNLETTLAKACELDGQADKSKDYLAAANRRKETIQQFCWVEDKGFYFDFDFVVNGNTEYYTLAAAFPLFFRIASQEQAQKVSKKLEAGFLQPGGLATTLLHTGQQWDAPNGWAPLQWIGFKGLKNYGLDLAEKVKKNWLDTNQRVYASTGKMTEKYNVFNTDLKAGGGEYPNQDGFGWTNGVFLAMLESH